MVLVTAGILCFVLDKMDPLNIVLTWKRSSEWLIEYVFVCTEYYIPYSGFLSRIKNACEIK